MAYTPDHIEHGQNAPGTPAESLKSAATRINTNLDEIAIALASASGIAVHSMGVPPTVDDDSGSGHEVPDFWVVAGTPDRLWICVDNSVGAAEWIEVIGLGTASHQAAAGNHDHDADYSDIAHDHSGVLPTAGEKSGLAGTSGTPGAGNPFVTDADSRLSDARTPTSHTDSHKHGGADEIATATAAANAIPKAEAAGTLASGWIPDLSIDGGTF